MWFSCVVSNQVGTSSALTCGKVHLLIVYETFFTCGNVHLLIVYETVSLVTKPKSRNLDVVYVITAAVPLNFNVKKIFYCFR